MAGIYTHIPFCKSVCGYCDFFRSTDLSRSSAYVEALKAELTANGEFLSDRQIKTVYFGGGTPSTLPPKIYTELIEQMAGIYDLSEVEEITLEANPDDLSSEYLKALADSPINRLSIGIQSLHDDELQFMNRRHDAATAIKVIKEAQCLGFDNISIDLIYGLPCSTTERWKENLKQALSLNIQHISAYHLGIEPRTRFGTLASKGKLKPVDEATSQEQYITLRETLLAHGFEHYEISNFALPEHHSRHNSSYWNDTQYLGLGAGAHSYDGHSRRWVAGNLGRYIALCPPTEIYTREELTEDERYDEYIMTRLRTAKGVNIEELQKKFGARKLQYFSQRAEVLKARNMLKSNAEHTFIPPEKYLISNSIICGLFAE